MSLEHEFFLIPKGIKTDNWIDWYSNNRYTWREKVEIEDSLIYYIFDALKWVSSYNPGNELEGNGLNYYGQTIIHKQGAEELSQIMHGWIALFSSAPEEFKLKSEIVWIEEAEGDGFWQDQFVEYIKTKVLDSFSKLLSFSSRAQTEEYFILHCGI